MIYSLYGTNSSMLVTVKLNNKIEEEEEHVNVL
jgi:hypothetical protein